MQVALKKVRSLAVRIAASDFLADESGQTTTEYAMVISVMSIAVLSSFFVFSSAFATALEALSGSLATSLTDDGIRM